MSLLNQITKARKINSTICLINGCAHKHVTACRSLTSPELNYQQVIKPIANETIDGYQVIIYQVSCQKIQATGLINCRGNGHCHTLCQHSISGIWAVIKALGKHISFCSTFASAKLLMNLYKCRGGKLVKLAGESGTIWGVYRND